MEPEYSALLRTVSTGSFIVWVIVWLVALAVLDTSSAAFLYLLFGLLEPVLFLYRLLASDRSTMAAGVLALLVLIHTALHVVAVLLRFLLLSLPLSVAQVLEIGFFVVALGQLFLYAWYFLCAYRCYVWLASEPQDESYSVKGAKRN